MYNEVLKRKEKIIITAIDLLDEAGINGLTTKEIARRQNITEPAIYKQFKGKKEIVMAILDRCAAFDDLIKNTLIDNKISGKDGILYFVKAYAEYYQNYPQITTAMFSFDMFRYDIDLHERMNQIVNERMNIVFSIISKGIEVGEFPKEMDKVAFADSIFGVIWSTTFMWQMGGCSFDLKNRIMKAMEIIVEH